MIQVERLPEPAILHAKARAWCQRLLQAREKHAAAPSAQTVRACDLAEGRYRHPEVKQALVTMFCGKCAYCESKITHVDYGHIEHYRPKSRYPRQTFRWRNLLLACGICNGPEHKGDHFPSARQGGPLVHPCEDDPEQHFRFVYNAKAKLASVYGKTRRGRTTEKLLGLNRPELRVYRSRQVQRLIVLSRLAAKDTEAQALLNEARKPGAEYAAFARHYRLS